MLLYNYAMLPIGAIIFSFSILKCAYYTNKSNYSTNIFLVVTYLPGNGGK